MASLLKRALNADALAAGQTCAIAYLRVLLGCTHPRIAMDLVLQKDIFRLTGPLDALTKGLPPSSRAADIPDLGQAGWNLLREDLPLPVAVLRHSALERNEAWMRAFRERTGVLMAPHGKTTMSPQLFRMQLDAGCWAITVATVHQMRVCRHFGIERIVLANQLIGRQEIDYVLSEAGSAARVFG